MRLIFFFISFILGYTKHSHRLRKKNHKRQVSVEVSSKPVTAKMSFSYSYAVPVPNPAPEEKKEKTPEKPKAVSWRENLHEEPKDVPCPAMEWYEKAMAGMALDPTSPDSKRKEMKKVIFSQGAASFLFDDLDPYFLPLFEKNLKEDFEAFMKLDPPKGEFDPPLKPKPKDGKPYISLNQLYYGYKNFSWILGKKPTNALELITKSYDFENKDHLNFKEFAYLNIRENIKNEIPGNCEHCLKEIKTELKAFFSYLNCDKSGFIDSQALFLGIKNIKVKFPVTTSMTNKFLLNTMEFETTTLDKRDFVYGFLMGMFERVVSPGGISEETLNMMKEARIENLKMGLGPK